MTGIEPGRGSVRVSTDGDEITARACVVAAGAWGRALLAGAEIELPVVPTRETVTYFRLPDPMSCRPSSTMPCRTPRSTACSGRG